MQFFSTRSAALRQRHPGMPTIKTVVSGPVVVTYNANGGPGRKPVKSKGKRRCGFGSPADLDLRLQKGPALRDAPVL